MQKSDYKKTINDNPNLKLYDSLTGLPNKTMFNDRLSIAIQNSKQYEKYFYSVLSINLECSNDVIDGIEHYIINDILVKLADTFIKLVRSIDTVARISEYEFAILLENVRDFAETEQVASRIIDKLNSELAADSCKYFHKPIIGIVFSNSSIRYEDPEQVLNDAKTSMYRAKIRGVSHYLSRASVKTDESYQRLKAELLDAIERKEFELYYQPIVSLKYQNIAGSEALIRWKHPIRGYISPSEFMPLIERTGLINKIGEWVIRTACKQTKAWIDAFNSRLKVSVNCSALQFYDRSFFNTITNCLNDTKLPPYCLSIEITESTAMRNLEITAMTLKRLSDLGIEISIDDFGTGYSSLAYLKKFPVDYLKIDKSFICDITNAYEDASITSAIISMAQSLDLKVIAEGVETDEQLLYLISQECDEMQGFVFSRAINANEFSKLLNQKKILSSATLEKSKLRWGRKPLGTSLVKNGYITKEQLNQALQQQKQTGQKLGQVLVKKGYISEDVLIEALARQHGVRGINLYTEYVDKEVTSLIPKELSIKYKAIPIRFTKVEDQRKLIVAMANPSDIDLIDMLVFITGFEIDPVFFIEEGFERIIEFHY